MAIQKKLLLFWRPKNAPTVHQYLHGNHFFILTKFVCDKFGATLAAGQKPKPQAQTSTTRSLTAESSPAATPWKASPTLRTQRGASFMILDIFCRHLEQLQRADPNGRHFCPLFVHFGRPPARRPPGFRFGSAVRPTRRPICAGVAGWPPYFNK
jgi:hypothetical protein